MSIYFENATIASINEDERSWVVLSYIMGMKDDIAVQGDMVYQLLSHAATNNNSGGMRDALDKYNAYYRH